MTISEESYESSAFMIMYLLVNFTLPIILKYIIMHMNGDGFDILI